MKIVDDLKSKCVDTSAGLCFIVIVCVVESQGSGTLSTVVEQRSTCISVHILAFPDM
jgi:hypothetical protein